MTQASFFSTARSGRLRAIKGLTHSKIARSDPRAFANASRRRPVAQISTIDRLMDDYDNIVSLTCAHGLPRGGPSNSTSLQPT